MERIPLWVRYSITFIVITLLFIFGESLTGLGIKYIVMPLVEPRLAGHPQQEVLAAVWVVSAFIIIPVGYLLGLLSIWWNKKGAQKPAKPQSRFARWVERSGFKKWTWIERILYHGRVSGFVLASFLGGAALVGWWYVTKNDPHVRLKTWLSACVLGIFAPGWWLAFYTPGYRLWGIGIALGVPAATLLYPALAARLWPQYRPRH